MYPTLDELAEKLGGDPEWHRFARRLIVAEPPPWEPELGPCLMRPSSRDSTGYAVFFGTDHSGRRRQFPAHLWLYEHLRGPVPPGHELDHRCHYYRYCVPEKAKLDPHRACVLHTRAVPKRANRLRANSTAANNYRRRVAALSGQGPVWCTGKFGPHDLSLPENQYFQPSTRSLKCAGCRPHYRNTGARGGAMRATS